jgi:DNA-binding transcriptional ArsR family regulator
MADELVDNLTADFLKSLAHPVRVKVVNMLEAGERCVCELIEEIEIEQSNLSQHLAVMKRQGLIDSRKEGTKVFYRIKTPAVTEVLRAVEKAIGDQISQSQNILKILQKRGDVL